MLAITSERVSLTEKLINSQSQDVRAAARNRELLVDLRQALHTLHATQRRAREEDQLAELRAELLEVQARRERARADFEADLRAKEEAARIKQELAAQKELERYERVEREAVRAGVSAEVAAAVTAVEDGLADVVRRAAAQTRQAGRAKTGRRGRSCRPRAPVPGQERQRTSCRTRWGWCQQGELPRGTCW